MTYILYRNFLQPNKSLYTVTETVNWVLYKTLFLYLIEFKNISSLQHTCVLCSKLHCHRILSHRPTNYCFTQGGSVIRMLRFFMGEQTFLRGLQVMMAEFIWLFYLYSVQYILFVIHVLSFIHNYIWMLFLAVFVVIKTSNFAFLRITCRARNTPMLSMTICLMLLIR